MSIKKQDIVLRPRFKKLLNKKNTFYLEQFQMAKTNQKKFIVSIIDDHVFLKLPKDKQQFWSPQLHLEINEDGEKTAILHGVFGPNPTVWTMFMFFHFIVAGLFIAFAIWAYSNWALDNSYVVQLGVMFLLVILWFVLYFAGRIGKDSSKEEMHDLYDFMIEVINEKPNNK
ncbi:GTP-binding protein [Hanstruepera ponticola]|uniref:GTP-binding protein n=1 Tax=Hanstruepera ponticola TaxID=2042995 RepID=UPI00177F17EC|nr:GTP-binding protein [Hanstruepera ponticola]